MSASRSYNGVMTGLHRGSRVFAFVLCVYPLFGQTTNVVIDNLIGIPFMRVNQPENRSQITAVLTQYIKMRLTQLDNWPADYSARPLQKAVAVRYQGMSVDFLFTPYEYRQDSIRPHIGYWGGGWGYDSSQEAVTSAMKECGESCVIFLENENVVGMDALVDDYIRARQQHIDRQKREMAKANVIVVIDRAKLGTAVARATGSKAIPFTPDDHLILGYPDFDHDYLSACNDLVFYAFLPVSRSQEAQSLRRMTQMESANLYGFYSRSAGLARDYLKAAPGRLVDSMAHFTRHFTFATDPRSNKYLVLPKSLDEALSGQTIKKVWVEGSIRLAPDGSPLVADVRVSPLALQTDQHFYLGIEIHMPDDGGSCLF
jgi:hypothetical protein